MGKKRYYCDFCDKYMVDNPQMRRNHNQGLQHSTAKRAHYNHYKDAEEILEEDRNKQKCRRYLNTGVCDYGDGCRYSHITPHCYQQLLEQVELKRSSRLPYPSDAVDVWLNSRAALTTNRSSDSSPNKDTSTPILDCDRSRHPLPEIIASYPLPLPPSLLPPGFSSDVQLGPKATSSSWG